MRVLVACEYSGIVRDAFAARGHDAWSCDILPSERPGNHIQGDCLAVLDGGWDLMVAHPPCTYLSKAGARWFKVPGRAELAAAAAEFVNQLWAAPIAHIAIENPRGLLFGLWRRPDQTIQPYWFGEHVTKATCLWLKNLPPLMATVIDPNPIVNWTKHSAILAGHGFTTKESSHARSRFWPGIAAAMANQWGGLTVAYGRTAE